ncbi:MAG TPA: hypothetical protein VFM43_01710 [Gaiellaceae bacterium]|nr:hypothetical protein [Gaiellaceae bacterium]
MAATAERQQLTGVLLDQVQRTNFPAAAQLDRIERLISTRDELEDYIAILAQKVQGKAFPHGELLDRLERLLRVLQRADEEDQ